ncbi:MAG: HDOD domain-containing protein [Sedimentisphaerales bacterium]|nr:HDOD domain-containing protein [Sedimentisphaerales bacterium]
MTQAVAKDLAAKTTEISTLPEVTMRIIEIVQDPRSTAHDLHEIVCNDPALSARVLRVVNSAFYGLPGQIGSIDRAIMLLGLNAVKNIAIAASLSKMFKTPTHCDDFNGKDLWTHSVAVGACNKLITNAIGLSLPDEAFLGGLIHDLGLVAVMQCHGPNVHQIVNLVRAGADYIKAEEQVIGANHQEIGMALAARWKFPRSFQYVTGYHHAPTDLARENRLLAIVTFISDVVCQKQKLGMTITAATNEVDPALMEEIRLNSGVLEDICGKIEEELETVRALIE